MEEGRRGEERIDEDELLQPTIRSASRSGPAPWDPRSQLYVAFFGGVIALTAIAVVNGRRLGIPSYRIRLILLAGLAGLAATLGLALVLPVETGVDAFLNEGSRNIRLLGRVVAVVASLASMKIQERGDRLFRIRGGEYSSPWAPGILAAIVGGLAQAALVFAVVNAR
jgi:hypothetical protein